MKPSKINHKLILGLFAAAVFCFSIPQTAFSQTEKLGSITYTPPKGWKKSAKENIVTYSQIDEAAGKFGIITLYGATPGTGNAQSDFTREWNKLVVKPWGAEASPKTEAEVVDGWTAIAGGSAVDFQGNKAVAFLSVMSKAGTTVSVLGIFNEESYLPNLVAFSTSMDIRQTTVAVTPQPMREEPASTVPAGGDAMHVVTLVKDFESNEIRAGQTWSGKRVRIYGTINTIEVQKDGRISLTFKSSLAAYGNVRCYFNQSQSSRVGTLSTNQEATVEGTVRGWEGGYDGAKVFVLVENCVVP